MSFLYSGKLCLSSQWCTFSGEFWYFYIIYKSMGRWYISVYKPSLMPQFLKSYWHKVFNFVHMAFASRGPCIQVWKACSSANFATMERAQVNWKVAKTGSPNLSQDKIVKTLMLLLSVILFMGSLYHLQDYFQNSEGELMSVFPSKSRMWCICSCAMVAHLQSTLNYSNDHCYYVGRFPSLKAILLVGI